jgi:hypothetical protein
LAEGITAFEIVFRQIAGLPGVCEQRLCAVCTKFRLHSLNQQTGETVRVAVRGVGSGHGAPICGLKFRSKPLKQISQVLLGASNIQKN